MYGGASVPVQRRPAAIGGALIPGPQRAGSNDAGGSTAGAGVIAQDSVPKDWDSEGAASTPLAGPAAAAATCTSSGTQSWLSSRTRPDRISQKSGVPLFEAMSIANQTFLKLS